MSLRSVSDSMRRLRKKVICCAVIILTPLSLLAAFCQDDSASACRNQHSLASPILAVPSPLHRQRFELTLSKGKFLVASQNMGDPRFSETVILLIECGSNGAIGLIINRPTDVRLSAILPETKELALSSEAVYWGGPVGGDQLFLLVSASRQPEESQHVFADIYASSSHKSLQQIISNNLTPKRFHAYAGYAGWAPLQLDREVLRGDWHILQADTETIFNKKGSEMWRDLIRRVSVQWVEATDTEQDVNSAGQRFVRLFT